jgi:hypothetical protein
MFLETELKPYFPEKLHLNCYSLLGLKILQKCGVSIMDKSHLIEAQLKLTIGDFETKELPSDLLSQLTILKLLNNQVDLNIFQNPFKEALKQLISEKSGLINDNITDSVRVLLIFDMLGVRTEESFFLNNLINTIISQLNLFQDSGIFNWRSDKIALKAELRMLFWVLIALNGYETVN